MEAWRGRKEPRAMASYFGSRPPPYELFLSNIIYSFIYLVSFLCCNFSNWKHLLTTSKFMTVCPIAPNSGFLSLTLVKGVGYAIKREGKEQTEWNHF